MPVVVLFHQQNPDVHSCFINTHKAIVTCIHANIHTVSQWLMLNPSKEADQDICPSSCLRKIYRWAIFPVCRVSVTILTSHFVKILDLSLIQYIHLYYNTATELDDKVKQFVRKHSYPKNYT